MASNIFSNTPTLMRFVMALMFSVASFIIAVIRTYVWDVVRGAVWASDT
jgi:hypothetical protein